MKLHITSHVLEPSESYPFAITAKCYRPEGIKDDPEGLTLVFAHAIGLHKETFEPTIERLFELQAASNNRTRIRDAWSIDSIQHGEAAVLNEELLKTRFLEECKY
jgi:hypothetical protein